MDPSAANVLLTGANGFAASHILDQLIDKGFHVTATVRSRPKAEGILKRHPSWASQVKFKFVSDVAADGAFDHVFTESDPFDYVIHTASPLDFYAKDVEKDLIDPAVRGTTGILKSAYKHGGPTLKRLVLLGSAVSILNSFEDMGKAGKPYTEKDWNPVTAAQAIEKKENVLGYNAGKKLAEQAAWEFMEESQPVFDLTVINPDIIIGPMIHEVSGPDSVNQTNGFAIHSFIDGTHKEIEGVLFPFYHFVDVRDVARAHVESLTNPAASNQRILLIAGLISPQLVVNIIRENFPFLRSRVPEGEPSQILPKGIDPTGWDTQASLKILEKGANGKKWGFIDLKQSVVDTVQSFIDSHVV